MNECVTWKDLLLLLVAWEIGKLSAVFLKALFGPSVKVLREYWKLRREMRRG